MDKIKDRIRVLMASKDYTAKDLGGLSGIGYRTIENWLSNRGPIPRADSAVTIARQLGTTVEFLVEGEKGANYVRNLVIEEGAIYHPPGRLASIVADLGKLDDNRLATVRTIVRAMVGESEGVEKAEGS